jgi:hypothetical protein
VATLSLPQTVASNPFIASALPSPAAAFSGVPAPIAPFHVQGNSTGTIQSQRAESLARIASRPPSSQISPSRQNRSRSAASARASARPFGQVTDANSTPLNPGQHAYLICFLPFTVSAALWRTEMVLTLFDIAWSTPPPRRRFKLSRLQVQNPH